jgi:hypothetical protein
MQAVPGEVEQTTEGLVQQQVYEMAGCILKFKFYLSINVRLWRTV